MFDLYEELRKIILLLDTHHLDYALCGGLALAVYDRPRATADIDLLILADSLDDVLSIAQSIGYTIRGKDMSFADGGIDIRRVSKIDKETGIVLSLDLLLVTPQIKRIWDARLKLQWEDGELSVVSREGLIDLKRMGARPQDLADVSALMEDVDDATS